MPANGRIAMKNLNFKGQYDRSACSASLFQSQIDTRPALMGARLVRRRYPPRGRL
jgi:hypothetical protein